MVLRLARTRRGKLRFSIVIVSWNVEEDLANCIRSIEENRPCGEFEVIVVDNASTDGTAETIRSDFPQVTLIANDENRGFAAANNIGIENSGGRYVLFLNPDTIVHPGSLDALVRFMDDNEDVGACGPKRRRRSAKRLSAFSSTPGKYSLRSEAASTLANQRSKLFPDDAHVEALDGLESIRAHLCS